MELTLDGLQDNRARSFEQRLHKEYRLFQDNLPADLAIRVTVVLPNGHQIEAERTSHRHPDMLIFYGKDSSGRVCTIVTHFAHVHVIFTAVPETAETRANPIGFRSLTPNYAPAAD